MNPDVILSWPRNCEYPLFRALIRSQRDLFSKVIIVFTDHGSTVDYSAFVRAAMQEYNIIFLDSPMIKPGEDWRNVAINAALKLSDNEWVMFLEQDFLIKDPESWAVNCKSLSIDSSVFGVFDGPRLHPCCIGIKRSLLDTTAMNFGIIPDKLDHFGILQQELDDRNIAVGVLNTAYYHHMNGLSHNFHLATILQEITYKPDEFKAYLRGCLGIETVPIDPRFIAVANSILHQ